MSDDRLQLMLEAERRGLLPDSKLEALAEARRRGLVPVAPVPMDPLRAPEPTMQTDDRTQWQMVGEDLGNAGKGIYRGLEATAQAGAQLAMRTPHLRAGEFASELAGTPDYTAMVRQSVDDQAAASARAFDESPAGNSIAGQGGRLLGEVLATGPAAVATLPVKGASVGSYLGRTFFGGALTAGMQPVTEGDFAATKTSQMLTGGTVGAGVAGGLRGGMSLAERIGFAPNALAQVSNVANARANRTPYAAEGEALAERTGVKLTPGQVSGSRVQTALENMARQSVFSSDIAAMADAKIADNVIGYIDRAMDGISRNPASAANVGANIQAATSSAVSKITARQAEVARQQFGQIEAALKGRKFVQYQQSQRVMDDLISEYGSIATPEAERIVAQATKLRDRLGSPHSLSQFQLQRQYFGRAGQGKGTVFDDVDRTINQRLARRIYAAMSDDLDASAARLDGNVGAGIVPADYFAGQTAGSPGLGRALREANDNYRRYSQLAEGIKAHPIARLFGKDIRVDGEDWFNTLPPEAVVTRLGNMAPTEVGQVRRYMENADPDTWQQYKRMLVQDALDKAQTLPTSAGPQTLFSPAAFLRALGGDSPAKIARLRETFGTDEMAQINDAFAVARRLGDRFGSNPSGTGAYNEVQTFLQSFREHSAQAAASTAGEALGLRKVANVMLNADGRRALIELSRLPPQSRQAAALMGTLSAIMAGKQQGGPAEQQPRARGQVPAY